jgi:hypothetical protein
VTPPAAVVPALPATPAKPPALPQLPASAVLPSLANRLRLN